MHDIPDSQGSTLSHDVGMCLQVRTRAATLPQFISASEAINSAALRLLRPELPIEIRLMGLRMSNFLEVHLEPGQRSMSAFLHAQPGQAEPAEHAAAPAADGAPDQLHFLHPHPPLIAATG